MVWMSPFFKVAAPTTAVIFLLWLWIQSTNHPPPPSSAPQLRSHPVKPLTSFLRPIEKQTTGVPQAPQISLQLPSDEVPFTVEDGLAVAMGDIVIGVPDSPELKDGVATLFKPDYWLTPEIPYAIDPELVAPERVMRAIEHIQDKTGLRFVPYAGHPDALLFEKGSVHCLSPLGRLGGMQPIRLNANCGWKEITHEILHSLGFIHEQSRVDRDRYVSVLWDNIEENFKDQFQILPVQFLGPAQGTAFDYQSIMLYQEDTFAKDKSGRTLSSKTQQSVAPSQDGLSEGDIHRIQRFFRLGN